MLLSMMFSKCVFDHSITERLQKVHSRMQGSRFAAQAGQVEIPCAAEKMSVR